MNFFSWPAAIAILAVLGFSFIKVIAEYEKAVIFRLGRLIAAKGPGLIILIPGVDRMVKISLRILTTDVPTQDVITKDNVSIKVNAVLLFRVVDAVKAVVNVEDYLESTFQYAQTTLRSVLGAVELDILLGERDRLNKQIQEILDQHTEPWGIKVIAVEIKQVDLPTEMQRAMAQEAVAERSRRAKIINAEGEAQAAKRLVEAAREIDSSGSALQLRYLQTLTEIASENSSTIIFPIPLDLFKPFIQRLAEPKDR